MTARTKSGLALAGTLVLGMLLGALAVGALGQWRAGRIAGMRRPGGFVDQMERVIRPRDAEQRDALRPILERTEERNGEIMRSAGDELRAALQELRDELDPLLDDEQRERLQRFARAPGGDPFGPPGGGPGRPGPPGGRDPRRRGPPR